MYAMHTSVGRREDPPPLYKHSPKRGGLSQAVGGEKATGWLDSFGFSNASTALVCETPLRPVLEGGFSCRSRAAAIRGFLKDFGGEGFKQDYRNANPRTQKHSVVAAKIRSKSLAFPLCPLEISGSSKYQSNWVPKKPHHGGVIRTLCTNTLRPCGGGIWSIGVIMDCLAHSMRSDDN